MKVPDNIDGRLLYLLFKMLTRQVHFYDPIRIAKTLALRRRAQISNLSLSGR